MEATGICHWINVATERDERGVLSHLEEGNGFPFPVKRFFFIREVPEDATRAGHATRNCDQLVLAARGRFTVKVGRDGACEEFEVSDDGRALFMPAGCWRELCNFSPGAICMVLASEIYSRSDYSDKP